MSNNLTSSLSNSKSNTSILDLILEGVTDLGKGIYPLSKEYLTHICAIVLLYLFANSCNSFTSKIFPVPKGLYASIAIPFSLQ